MVLCPRDSGKVVEFAQMASKITFDTVRKIASGLPGVEESTSYGTPSLKIGGRLLACMAINKSAEPNSLGLSIDFDQREALLAEAPDTYYITDHYVNGPFVLVRLSRVNYDVLRDLLHAAWKFVSANKPRKQSSKMASSPEGAISVPRVYARPKRLR